MKNIIIPTDFSEVANQAAQYGLELAKAYNSKVTIMHVLSIPISDIGASITVADELLSAQKEHVTQKMGSYVDEMNRKYGVEVKGNIEVGMAAEEICEYAKAYADLIIMGSTGESGLLNKLLGSIASAVVSNAETPVLVVPKDVSFTPWKNIAIANDHQTSMKEELNWLYPNVSEKKCLIHLISVEAANSESYQTEIINQEGNIREVSIFSPSIEEGLMTYSHKEHIDILGVKPKERGFIEGFFHKSITQSLLSKTPLPILVFKS